jgi:hypothetical protein
MSTHKQNISLLEAVRDPDRLRARFEDVEATALQKTQQEDGNLDAHTLGENMVDGLEMRTWSNVLEGLDLMDHPATEADHGHPIVEYPRALLDNVTHLSEIDKIRLEENELSELPKQRRLVFEWLAERPEIVSDLRVGGTDFLAHGPKGSGKSTFAMTWVARVLEINNEAVVWRGSSARSEWLPLRPWATVCLPAGINAEAVLDPPSDQMDPIEVDLEAAVRDVVRYDDVRDLNENVLQKGGFHVVYPDPRFRGCDEVFQEADEISSSIEHVSAWDAARDDDDVDDVTPVEMWWFAWAIGKIEFGPPYAISWFCDEIGNLFPEHASNDYHDQFARIEALRNKYVDARRNNFSLYGIGHDPEDEHSLMRKKQRWRVTMNGVDNPTGESVVGMGEAPMRKQYTANQTLGEGLFWNKQNFAEFEWSDTPAWLKVPGQLQIRFPEIEEVLQEC